MTEKIFSEAEIIAKTDEVTKLLQDHNVPISEWGTGEAKTLRDLVTEILTGESNLMIIGSEVFRQVEIVHVDVRYATDYVEKVLYEAKQVFADGRTRERHLSGVSEKMIPGEDPTSAAKRALSEELGINTNLNIESLSSTEETKPSQSYPGLNTQYKKHEARVFLPESAYNPRGYTEVQPDKITHFAWRSA